jgi:hypothetical protein
MTSITLDDLETLGSPINLQKVMQALATLDAIISPEWDYRYYSFNSKWASGEMMGSMRNGSGDELFAHFSDHGVFIKGFDHEKWEEFPAQKAYKDVPACFSSALTEVAFSLNEVTLCIWFSSEKAEWYYADIPSFDSDKNFSSWMLDIYDGNPNKYLVFAAEYYEIEAALEPIVAIFNHVEMTSDLAYSLNPEVDYQSLLADLGEIGSPVA